MNDQRQEQFIQEHLENMLDAVERSRRLNRILQNNNSRESAGSDK